MRRRIQEVISDPGDNNAKALTALAAPARRRGERLRDVAALYGSTSDRTAKRRLTQEVIPWLRDELLMRRTSSRTSEGGDGVTPSRHDTNGAAPTRQLPDETTRKTDFVKPGHLLESVLSSFSAKLLAGYWVTFYEYLADASSPQQGVFDHVEIVRIRATSNRTITAKNWPPEPRSSEPGACGFRNVVHAELAGRHLIGHWRNTSDRRYFGAIHLAVLTGEDIMEGAYTGLWSDVKVDTRPWKWVRLAGDISRHHLSGAVLKDPRTIRSLIEGRSIHDSPLTLDDVTDERT